MFFPQRSRIKWVVELSPRLTTIFLLSKKLGSRLIKKVFFFGIDIDDFSEKLIIFHRVFVMIVSVARDQLTTLPPVLPR